MKLLEQIFSLTNEGYHKVITLCGVKLKVRINYFKQYKNSPIDNNKIVFSNFNGAGYGCNPKYITEEIIKRNLPYKLVWLCNEDNIDDFEQNQHVRACYKKSKQAIMDIATAKILISNVRLCKYIGYGWNKKNGQKYIQTWHGSLGIKKIDAQVKGEVFVNRPWWDLAHVDSEYIDVLLSDSKFEDDVFKTSMWYSGDIIKTGHPRNDIFFKSSEEQKLIKEKVFRKLRIPPDKKIALYVPSFRDDARLDCYALDVAMLKNSLKNKFGGEWVVVERMHPRLQKYSTQLFDVSKDYIIDGSYYPDIQELLLAADIAITDYSSCIFDFILSRKPGFIFATDIEKYDNERGFYYPLSSTPFPVATGNEELAHNIENFDYDKYKIDVEEFLEQKGCMEDGHASERVVDLIEEIIENA